MVSRSVFGRWRAAAWAGAPLVAAALMLATAAGASDQSAGERAYARQDYARASALLSREAEKGRARAQAYLGYMYYYGLGVPQDYVESTRWLRRGAEQGEPTAQFLLGMSYDKGRGVPQDFVTAQTWLELAVARVDAGHREEWTLIRNAVASKLTRAELREAQQRALAFVPRREP